MIRTLDRHMLRELLPLLGLGTALFAGIIILFSPLKEALELAREAGIGQGTMWTVLGLRSLGIIPFVLPMGMLFGCALLSGRMAGNGELIAAYSAGLPLWGLMRWVFVLAAVVGLLGAAFHEQAVVPGLRKAREIETSVGVGQGRIREHVRFVEVSPATNEAELLVYAARLDPATGTLYDVTAVLFDSAAPRVAQAAEAHHLGEGRWELRDVDLWGDGERHLATLTIETGREPDSLDVGRKDLQGIPAGELRGRARDMQAAGEGNPNIKKLTALFSMELWQRWAVPLTCFPFALLGVSLGARKQGGGLSLALGLSVLVCFLYYTVLRYADTAGREGLLPPFVAAGVTPSLALALGLVLLVRSRR